MVSQKPRTSPVVRAYEQADQYVVMPKSIEGNDWWVTKRDGTAYTVDLDAPRCDCPAFHSRRNPGTCKHVELVRLHVAMDAQAPTSNPFEEEEMDPEYAAQLTAELNAETDAEMDRIAHERAEWNTLWGPQSEWD